MILSRRPNDDDRRDGFTKWPFMTTHTWGEYPWGEWILEVIIHNYLTLKYIFFCKGLKSKIFIVIYYL